MNGKNYEFEKGYLCAVATLVRMEGTNTTKVDELFDGCPMTISKMREIGLDESDIEVLETVVEEFERRENLRKLKK